MSNPADSQKTQTVEAIQAEAQRLLDEIKQFKANADEHLKATEAARKKADDDATYAYQAKLNTESHASRATRF